MKMGFDVCYPEFLADGEEKCYISRTISATRKNYTFLTRVLIAILVYSHTANFGKTQTCFTLTF